MAYHYFRLSRGSKKCPLVCVQLLYIKLRAIKTVTALLFILNPAEMAEKKILH